MKLKHIFLSILLIAPFISQMALAELRIEITQGSDSALPIAIVPFSNKGAAAIPFDVARIVANDLQRSGIFNTLSTSSMLSLPDNQAQIFYRDWRMLGQNYILVGQISYDNNRKKYDINYELVDVNSQKRLLGEKVSSSAKGLRKLAHYISDKVYETITGVRGVFSTKIAYITMKQLTQQKRTYRLQVADADGQSDYTLFRSNAPMLSPAWSNDGKQLAYVSFHSGRPAIYIQNIKTGKQKKLTSFKGLNSSPMWAPDDKSLVMTLSKDGNAEVYRYNLIDNKLDRLTNNYSIDTEASWSPKGDEIVFTSDRSGSPQVYSMNLSDRIAKRLTFDGTYNARPRFSRDGKSIYYVHRSDQGFNIAAIDIESGEQRVLTSTTLDDSPSVAPNGRMIIYSTLRDNKRQLAVISVDGGSKYFLPSSYGEVLEPAWSPFL